MGQPSTFSSPTRHHPDNLFGAMRDEDWDEVIKVN